MSALVKQPGLFDQLQTRGVLSHASHGGRLVWSASSDTHSLTCTTTHLAIIWLEFLQLLSRSTVQVTTPALPGQMQRAAVCVDGRHLGGGCPRPWERGHRRENSHTSSTHPSCTHCCCLCSGCGRSAAAHRAHRASRSVSPWRL